MTDTTDPVVETTVPDAIASEQPETEVGAQAESSPAVTDADETTEQKPKGVQKRIDELTRLRYDAERDRDHWRQMAMRETPPKAPQAEPEKPKAVPKLEDFNYDEAAYQAALSSHFTAEAARQVREELRREQEETQKQERVKSWKTRESEFEAKHADYKDLAHHAPISDAMADVIMESDVGPDLAYYLGKPENRDEALRIAQLDPVRAARALGRLEAKLEKPPAPAPKPVVVSKAPPPPPKIDATESAPRISTASPESDSMTDDEWVKAEQARLNRKAKRQ